VTRPFTRCAPLVLHRIRHLQVLHAVRLPHARIGQVVLLRHLHCPDLHLRPLHPDLRGHPKGQGTGDRGQGTQDRGLSFQPLGCQ